MGILILLSHLLKWKDFATGVWLGEHHLEPLKWNEASWKQILTSWRNQTHYGQVYRGGRLEDLDHDFPEVAKMLALHGARPALEFSSPSSPSHYLSNSQ